AICLSGLFGIVLLAGGIWLAALGGSWYYLLTGAVLIAIAFMLARGMLEALWLYALLVVATVAWALWEAGLDWWPLAARGDVLFLLGLFLLTPWVTRSLVRRGRARADVQTH